MAFEIQQTLWMQMFNVQPFFYTQTMYTKSRNKHFDEAIFSKVFLPLEKIYLKFNAAASCITFWLPERKFILGGN